FGDFGCVAVLRESGGDRQRVGDRRPATALRKSRGAFRGAVFWRGGPRRPVGGRQRAFGKGGCAWRRVRDRGRGVAVREGGGDQGGVGDYRGGAAFRFRDAAYEVFQDRVGLHRPQGAPGAERDDAVGQHRP